MLDATLIQLSRAERTALWKASVAARKRTVDTRHELNTELNAYCVLFALDPERILHIMQYASLAISRATAAAAYRMATDGIQLIAE